MSTDYLFYFKNHLPLAELAAWVQSNLGVRMEMSEFERSHQIYYCGRLLESPLLLHECRKTEIEGYDVTQMNYCLDLDCMGSFDCALAAFVLVSYSVLLFSNEGEGIVFYDNQRVLAQYIWREGRWIDGLSNVEVKFPQHLSDVFVRSNCRW